MADTSAPLAAKDATVLRAVLMAFGPGHVFDGSELVAKYPELLDCRTWDVLLGDLNVSEETLALADACLAVWGEHREGEWRALGLLLALLDPEGGHWAAQGNRLVQAGADDRRLRPLLAALAALGWLEDGGTDFEPAPPACEARRPAKRPWERRPRR